MVDVQSQLAAVSREIASEEVDGFPSRVQTLAQTYPSPIDDVWDAVTSADRIARWFQPISGDLMLAISRLTAASWLCTSTMSILLGLGRVGFVGIEVWGVAGGVLFGETPGAATAGELGAEGVEVRLPEPPERVEPGRGVLERLRRDGVEAAGTLRPHRREPRLAQYPQMLRHRGLRDAELALHLLADLAGAALALCQEFEDAPAHRVSEDVERVHETMFALRLI